MHCQHALRAHLAQRNRGHGVGQHAIHQQASANLYRQKHSRISATGAHRIDQRSGVKHDSRAGGKIRGGHGQRNLQFFEGLDLQNAAEKLDHALVAGKSVARQSPAGKILESHPGGHLFQFSDGDAAAIGCADERADAGAGHQADGNIFFFENFEDADMRDAAGKTAAQSQSDAGKAAPARARRGLTGRVRRPVPNE